MKWRKKIVAGEPIWISKNKRWEITITMNKTYRLWDTKNLDDAMFAKQIKLCKLKAQLIELDEELNSPGMIKQNLLDAIKSADQEITNLQLQSENISQRIEDLVKKKITLIEELEEL